MPTPWLNVIAGRVARSVAWVEWTPAEGRTVSATIRNGYFLANQVSPTAAAGSGKLAAYDQEGKRLETGGGYRADADPPAV